MQIQAANILTKSVFSDKTKDGLYKVAPTYGLENDTGNPAELIFRKNKIDILVNKYCPPTPPQKPLPSPKTSFSQQLHPLFSLIQPDSKDGENWFVSLTATQL